jgi:hypothetical protein
MTQTLALGSRPEYMRRGLLVSSIRSFFQEIRAMTRGNAFKGGDYRQVGGEFLFDTAAAPSLDAAGTGEWRVSWCHRMRNTRDHSEVAKLRRVLGFQEAAADREQPEAVREQPETVSATPKSSGTHKT